MSGIKEGDNFEFYTGKEWLVIKVLSVGKTGYFVEDSQGENHMIEYGSDVRLRAVRNEREVMMYKFVMKAVREIMDTVRNTQGQINQDEKLKEKLCELFPTFFKDYKG